MRLTAGVEPVIKDEPWGPKSREGSKYAECRSEAARGVLGAGTQDLLGSGLLNWTVMGIALGQEGGAEGQENKPRSEVWGQE